MPAARLEAGPRAYDAPTRALLGGILLAITLHAFDELAVTTALPRIVDDLGGRSLYGAVFFAYLLAGIVGLVGAGWQANRHGPTRPFVVGLLLFLSGLVVSAAAPTMAVVVLGRALQGLGGGTIATVVLTIINRAFDASERPRIMALVSAAWVVPSLIAPGAGGAIAEYAGWRWVFIALIPLVLVSGALAVPRTRPLGPGQTFGTARAALGRGLRLATGVGLLLGGLGRESSLLSAVMVIVGAALAWTTLRSVLPHGFASALAGAPAAVSAKLLLAAAFFGSEAFLPLALSDIHGAPAMVAGFALTSAALSWTAGAFLQARLATARSSAWIASRGGWLVLAGILALLPLLSPATPPWLAMVAWIVGGAGMGLAYSTCNVAAMADTRQGREGDTSTALGIADAIGISLGTGLGGALVNFGDRSSWDSANSVAMVWIAMAIVALLAILAARRLSPTETLPVAPSTPRSVGEL